MSNCDLHFMVNKLRNELKNRNIHVLCEAYDGQWHNHIVLGSNGQHLTKMHGKITWQHISKLSKDKCLEQLSVHSIIKNTKKMQYSNWFKDLTSSHKIMYMYSKTIVELLAS